MSKSREGHSGETFHQEYIASLRYRNDLPPPEMPPKLLDIPHEGLARFLTPGYAANLARREEPNIDVDAEGGMPIDLVGIPGLHLGDESGKYHFIYDCFSWLMNSCVAIMTPENPPPLHPIDVQLMMTPEQLRNPAPKDPRVSFLRRTQYISGSTRAPVNPGAPVPKPRPRQPAKPTVSHDDPVYIKKYIQKGFDIAYPKSKHVGEDTPDKIKGHAPTKAEHDAWARPVHPDNPKLQPVRSSPMIPDLDGFTDPGGFVQFKFDKPPIPGDVSKSDKRMDVSILYPSEPDERIGQEHATKASLHKTNPDLYPDPGPLPYNYDLYLPEKEATKNILASLSQSNPNRDDPNLYTHEGSDGAKYHRYDRIRTHATSSQSLSLGDKQTDIALVLHDPGTLKDSEREIAPQKQKGAYYYPILGKTRLTQRRTGAIARAGLTPNNSQGAEERIDQLHLVVRDPDEAESYKRALHRAAIDPKFGRTMPPPPTVPEEPEGQESGNRENAEGEENTGGEENAEGEENAKGEENASADNGRSPDNQPAEETDHEKDRTGDE